MTPEPTALRRTWALPVTGWVATTGALLAIAIGIGYDFAEREPGRFAGALILGGLALMTGAPWWLLGVWSGQVRRWASHRDDAAPAIYGHKELHQPEAHHQEPH